jgi:hypothetical protein
VKRLVFSNALLLATIVCAGQESTPDHNCTTHGFFSHKTPCRCGEVSLTSGDISLSAEAFGLDDSLDVELRDKAGNVLESKRLSYRNGRTFCFSGRPKAVYALAFISYKSGKPQPAAVHPVKYTAKGCGMSHVVYAVPPDCPK